MKKLPLAFLGFGYWGKNILRNLLDMDNVEVAAICDTNEDNLKKATEIVTKNSTYNPKFVATTDYNKIITNEEIEAVILATPPTTHFELAMKALKAGKHVFIEKPMTTDYQEAIDLVNQGILEQKIVMVGHTFIYHPVINDLKRLIDADKIGTVRYIDFQMLNLGKYQGKGVLWDLAPHGVSIILYLLNNPEVVRIEVNGISAMKTSVIDVAYLTLYFKNGSFANMHFSWANPHKERRLTVVGSQKMAVFDDINPLEKLRIYDKSITSSNKEFTSWGDSMVGYRHGDIVSLATTTGEPLKKELTHFVDCAINNKEPVTSGSNGAKVVKIIEEAMKQLEERK
jgi:predicted dehydrogenase